VFELVNPLPTLKAVMLRSMAAALSNPSSSVAWFMVASARLFLRGLGALLKNNFQLRSWGPLAKFSFRLASFNLGGPPYNKRLEATPGSFVAYLSVGGGALQPRR
jgi:hypothetical protein